MKEKEILDWAQSEIDKVLEKFGRKQNTAVSFDELLVLADSREHELYTGVWVVVERLTDKKARIACQMKAGSCLPIHHHPDYIEMFNLISGELYERVSEKPLYAGEEEHVMPNIPHEWEAIQDSEMEIYCKLV